MRTAGLMKYDKFVGLVVCYCSCQLDWWRSRQVLYGITECMSWQGDH